MGPNNVSENTVRKALAALAAAAVITVSGVAVATLSSTGATFSVPVLLPNGTVSAPALAQSADSANGVYFGTDQTLVAANGARAAEVNTTGLVLPSTATAGLNLYNTADETTNWEKGGLYWSGNILYLGTSRGGGGTLRQINIAPADGNVWVSGNIILSGANLAVTTATPDNPLILSGREAVGDATPDIKLTSKLDRDPNKPIVGFYDNDGAVSLGTIDSDGDWAAVGNVSGVGATFTGLVDLNPAAKSGTPGATGFYIDQATSAATDNNTAQSGTAALFTANSFAGPTLAATNTSVTTTDAATLYVTPPIAGTNETVTNLWALYATGNIRAVGGTFAGDISAAGGFVQRAAAGYHSDLADSQSDHGLEAGTGLTAAFYPGAAGSLLGLICNSNANKTAGTGSVRITKNGVGVAGTEVSIPASAGLFKSSTWAKDTYTFVATDYFGVAYTTDADFEPNTLDIGNCWVVFESGAP